MQQVEKEDEEEADDYNDVDEDQEKRRMKVGKSMEATQHELNETKYKVTLVPLTLGNASINEGREVLTVARTRASIKTGQRSPQLNWLCVRYGSRTIIHRPCTCLFDLMSYSPL